MTYRERRLAKAERLREWAEKREASAGAVLKSHERYRGDHAFNFQPGHIPERARVIRQAERAFESLDKAEGMASRADEIEAQADRAIYRDDPDEVERLEAKLAGLEAERDRWKAYNKSCRKGEGDLTLLDEKQRANVETITRVCPYQLGKNGTVSYTNLSANINRNRKRLEEAKRRQTALAGEGSRGYGRAMQARFDSECAECGNGISKGDEILYYRLTREAIHAECEKGAA